jgi:putative FmdB family regulatory protein
VLRVPTKKGGDTMPFYEYVCEACGKDFVLLQSMTCKVEDTSCPYCQEKKARKVLSKFSSTGTSAGSGSSCSIGGHSWGGG